MSGRYAGGDRRSFHSTGQQQHYDDAVKSGSPQNQCYQDDDETNTSASRQTHSSSDDHRRQREDSHQPHQQKQAPSRSMSGGSSAGGGGRGVRQRGATWREANAAGGPARRMEVAIPQNNLRVFASAIQCLVKVGKELFIEATADQLILRTLNDAKSAFAAFYFNDAGGFFENFRCDTSSRSGDGRSQDGCDTTQGSAGGGGGGSVSCKVPVRAVHSIFRTLKKVVRLVVYMEGEDEDHIEPNLVFQMYCEYGYRKVHRFSLQDCEIMHAVFEGEGASRLSCPPVQLSQLLEHIHGTAEVAVGASHDVLTVRSFHHPLTGSAERAVLKTEMSISTAEFDTYRFCGADDEEVELVFSLKEIKSLLHFCDTTEAQSLEILFREGGDPLLFQSHSKAFAGELIMATMEPRIVRKEEDQHPAQQQPARTSSNDRRAAGAGDPSVSHGSMGNQQQSPPGGHGRGSGDGGAAGNWDQERGGEPPEGHDSDDDPQYKQHEDREQHSAQNNTRIGGERTRKRSRDPREHGDGPQRQDSGEDDGVLQGGAAVGRRRHRKLVEDDQDSESTRSPGSASGGNPILDGNIGERGEWEGEARSRRRKGLADDDNDNDHSGGDGQSNGSDNTSISGRRRGRSSSRRGDEERIPGGRLERDSDPQNVGDGDADYGDDRERTGNQHSELPTQFPGLRTAFDSAPSSQHSSANLLAVADERERLSSGGGVGNDDGDWGMRDTRSRSRKRRYVQEEEEEEDGPNSDLRL